MLDRLSPNPGSRQPRTRVGRGSASGKGKTAGRGQKGAGSRSGHRRRPWYEGGQMPLIRRIPKRGFRNIFRVPRQVVKIGDLACFDAGARVDVRALAQARLVNHADRPVKILGDGELSKSLTLVVDAVSVSARNKIEAAGGSVEIVPTRRDRGSTRKPDAS